MKQKSVLCSLTMMMMNMDNNSEIVPCRIGRDNSDRSPSMLWIWVQWEWWASLVLVQ